jgi:hypothetical protein
LQRLLLLPLSLPSFFSSVTSSREWSDYIALSAELQLVNVSQLSPLEKTCFFLNVYHIMVLHGFVDRGYGEGCDIKDKWLQLARSVKYMVGAFNYSIESIEDSLKQIALAAASSTVASPRATGGIMLCMSRMVVGSPRVHVFHPSNWDGQLAAVWREVCAKVEVSNSTKTVVLPKVFEVHREMFPKDPQDFLAAISADCASDVQRAVAAKLSLKMKFHREDWRVAFPCQSDTMSSGVLDSRDTGMDRNSDAEYVQLPHAGMTQLSSHVRGANDHLFNHEQQQYALEYRGDLKFNLPPAPTFAPPSIPTLAPPNLTSMGLPALINSAK